MKDWDFVEPNFNLHLPPKSEFKVLIGEEPVEVSRVSFRRRPLYAPLKQRDLRILSHLYLELAKPIAEGSKVAVLNPSQALWKSNVVFVASMDPLRFNPALHVNQNGYQTEFPKQAMVGYYTGAGGELTIPAQNGFEIINEKGETVFKGELTPRRDAGFTYSPAPYQLVYMADFSGLKMPGTYRLAVDGMGASYPFQIHDGAMAAFTRAYALGLYHQRCGTNNALPFTRFTHEACHTAPAEVPDSADKNAQAIIAEVSSDAKQMPRHTAPQLANTDASLYPFVDTDKVDVRGGHHDAGDYSKYTINSAGLIHYLIFAADSFKGAGALDNLGLPESGDAKSDLLQEAKWEADFLAKMQDADGGFYFLVYPRERRYEDNVLPEKGDPQIVWPKTTAATAAAVGALAEAGSSPLMKKQFPEAADLYMRRALRGWAFLKRAIAEHGQDGSYQKLTHYGNEFLHDDELAWAAAALFAATGEEEYHERLRQWFDPDSTSTLRWSWWPMFEGWGRAARTYAFSVRSGRRQSAELDGGFLGRCEALILRAADNHVRFARNTAYGTSFPDPNKANRNAGWYFSSERAFDITVAWQLKQLPEYLEAILGNLNYEAGCNPVNVSYITGLGKRRQRDIVHQYGQNDHRILPPTGIPIGNIQAGFAFLYPYKKELGALPFPPDGASTAPYPYYDRWGDSFNTTTEFVVVDSARSLASLSYWMAQTPAKEQSWKPVAAAITGLPSSVAAGDKVSAKISVEGLDLAKAEIVWEARDQEPEFAQQFTFSPRNVGEQWIEAEACWPDGRRVFAAASFVATASLNTPPNPYRSTNLVAGPGTIALYHLDGSLAEATGRGGEFNLTNSATLDDSNLSWMKERTGSALRFKDLGDKATAKIPLGSPDGNALTEVKIEAMIFINEFKAYNRSTGRILSLAEDWNASLELLDNLYEGLMIKGGSQFSVSRSSITNLLTPRVWHHLAISVNQGGYEARIDGKLAANGSASELGNWGRKGEAVLELGDFDGYIDEIAVTFAMSGSTPPTNPPGGSTSGPGEVPRAPGRVKNLTATASRKYSPGKSNAIPLTSDSQSRGNWTDKYGRTGYKILSGGEQLPAGTRLLPDGAESYSWSENTPDVRALLKAGSQERVAACWYSADAFELAVETKAEPQLLTLYFLDWDRTGRRQSVKMIDPQSGMLLDGQVVSDFEEGRYLTWIISGDVNIVFEKQAGPNAVVMGIFLDPLTSQAERIVASPANR